MRKREKAPKKGAFFKAPKGAILILDNIRNNFDLKNSLNPKWYQ